MIRPPFPPAGRKDTCSGVVRLCKRRERRGGRRFNRKFRIAEIRGSVLHKSVPPRARTPSKIEGSYSHAKQSNHASHSSKHGEQTGPTLVRIPKTAGHRIGPDSTRQPSKRGSEILMRLREREREGWHGSLVRIPIGGSRCNTFDSGILRMSTRGSFL